MRLFNIKLCDVPRNKSSPTKSCHRYAHLVKIRKFRRLENDLIAELLEWHVILRRKPLENYLEERDEREKEAQELNDIGGSLRDGDVKRQTQNSNPRVVRIERTNLCACA